MSSTPRLVGTSGKSVIRVLTSSAALQIVGAFINLLILPRVLAHLGTRQYGEWATLAALVAIGQLVQGGTVTEIARRVAAAHGQGDEEECRLAVRQGVTVLTAIGLGIEVVAIASAHFIVNAIFVSVPASQRSELTFMTIGMVSLFVAGLVANGYFSVLSGLQRGDFNAWSSLASLVLEGAIVLIGLKLGFGLWALFVGAAVQQVVNWVGPMIGVRRLVPGMRFRFTRISRRVVLGFIVMPGMLVVANASDLFDNQVDKLVLAHAAGPSASAMFQIGVNFEQALRGAALVPLGVMLAGTAELFRTDRQRLWRLEMLAGSTTYALAAVGAGGLVIFAQPFVSLWLGAHYGQAALSARVLAVAALFNLWSAPWTYYALGRRRYYYVLICAAVTLVVNAVATILLTTSIGLDGALIGSVAGSAAGTLTGRLVVWRWEKRLWLLPAMRATEMTALVVAGALLVLNQPQNWALLVAYAVAYTAVAFGLLAVTGSLPLRVGFTRGRLTASLRHYGRAPQEKAPRGRHSRIHPVSVVATPAAWSDEWAASLGASSPPLTVVAPGHANGGSEALPGVPLAMTSEAPSPT